MEQSSLRGRRIAHVTPYFWPVVGGITTYVDGVASEQRRMGADVRVYSRSATSGLGVEVGPKNNLLFSRWVASRLRQWHPDVVHAHGDWPAFAASQRVWGPIARSTVFTVHTDFRPSRSVLREYILQRLMDRASVITAMNPASVRALAQRFPNARRIELTHPGTAALECDIATIQQLKEELNLDGLFPVISAVSMMVWPEKVRGLRLLVRAMKDITAQYPAARLLIVGDGNLRSEVEEEIELDGVGSSVILTGQRNDATALVALSNLFVHVSFRDAFPQVVLEAMSLGRPVLVNEEVAANLPSELKAGGLIVVPATPQGVADATKRLCQDDEHRLEIASRGQSVVRAEFLWDRVVEDLAAIYGLA